MVERLGAPQGSVDALARRARESGLEVVETSGFFQIIPPEQGFDLHASTIAAAKSRAIQSGVGRGPRSTRSSARYAPRKTVATTG
jgi:hypothetical protein